MEAEEIEKAARSANPYKVSESVGNCLSFNNGLKAGAEFVDKIWQEKTRWIPVEERLPAFGGKERTILVKTSDNLYSFLWIIQEVSLSDFECQGYTHWKEIEL